MERLLHDHNRRFVDIPLVSVHARQLDRCFVGLATRITEEDFLHTGQLGQFVRQTILQGHLIDVGRVQQAACLRRNRFHQRRVIVPQRIDGDTRQPVEVGLAIGIDESAAVAVAERDR